jgi:hypothetical protein
VSGNAKRELKKPRIAKELLGGLRKLEYVVLSKSG